MIMQVPVTPNLLPNWSVLFAYQPFRRNWEGRKLSYFRLDPNKAYIMCQIDLAQFYTTENP